MWCFFCHMQKLYNRNSALERFINLLRRRPISPYVSLRYIWDMTDLKNLSFISKPWLRFPSSTLQNLWLKFTEGKLLLTDFVESLQNSQTLCHRHLIQAEKIQNLILQAQIYNQDVDFSRLGRHPHFGFSPTAIDVFSGLYPVILLPGFQYPHLSPTSYLPPLKHHGCVDICSTLISKNDWSHKPGFCKCTETRQRPQRHTALQPLDKIQHNVHQNP